MDNVVRFLERLWLLPEDKAGKELKRAQEVFDNLRESWGHWPWFVREVVRLQLERLQAFGYESMFQSVRQLKDLVEFMELPYDRVHPGHIPILLVISTRTAPLPWQLSKSRYLGSKGFELDNYCDCDEIPDTPVYPVLDVLIHEEREILGKSQSVAREIIIDKGRLPLTLLEGISLILHYPEIMAFEELFGPRSITLLGSEYRRDVDSNQQIVCIDDGCITYGLSCWKPWVITCRKRGL